MIAAKYRCERPAEMNKKGPNKICVFLEPDVLLVQKFIWSQFSFVFQGVCYLRITVDICKLMRSCHLNRIQLIKGNKTDLVSEI